MSLYIYIFVFANPGLRHSNSEKKIIRYFGIMLYLVINICGDHRGQPNRRSAMERAHSGPTAVVIAVQPVLLTATRSG